MCSENFPIIDNEDHYRKYLYTGMEQIKSKAIPLQALTGPEGSRSLRLTDFKTIGT
jgi:hypothetical protein